ncbi:MAG TPA: spore protease YyaC [Candidatus Copromonas faecavium]|uniref:Spore protease YyaC n=1 Tax=Candidatus Copromonas faecavium (nom. illeg.) TaxID=2840740 RepID=A0A9D1A7A7_9FIRM|nr:spore protease YyaC [Candidatus Copromonas faecavium]
MKVARREIYYYDTVADFEMEKFAGRLLLLMMEELKEKRKTEIVFLCIGTDRSTGDSLGPLIGYKLKERGVKNARVMGTLDHPVHAMNLEACMERLAEKFPNALVVAVDASVGNVEHVGFVTLGRGSLKPGLGVKKELDAVGDIFITGIVGSSRSGDPLMLQSIRLSIVMRLADCISRSICLGMSLLGRRVENFLEEPAPF